MNARREHQINRSPGVSTPHETISWAQRRRLATAMRKAIELLVTTDASEDELRAAAERVERFVQRLETQTQRHVARHDPSPLP